MRDEAATGPQKPASAPLPGSPRNRQILWGGLAPGRLGREDARNFGGGTLQLGTGTATLRRTGAVTAVLAPTLPSTTPKMMIAPPAQIQVTSGLTNT